MLKHHLEIQVGRRVELVSVFDTYEQALSAAASHLAAQQWVKITAVWKDR